MSKTPKQNITPLVCLVYNFSNVSTEIKFQVHPQGEQKIGGVIYMGKFLKKFLLGVVNLKVLACLLRRTTERVVNYGYGVTDGVNVVSWCCP